MIQFKSLRSIRIDYYKIEEPLFALLASEMPFIEELNLRHAHLGVLTMDYTGKFKELKKFELVDSKIHDIGLCKLLKAMSNLSTLTICKCQDIGWYSDWKKISLKKLKNFILVFERQSISADNALILEFLFRSSLLEKIVIIDSFGSYPVENANITAALPKLQNLKILYLTSFQMRSYYLEKMLIDSTKIEDLEVRNISLATLSPSDNNLKWPNLQRLTLQNTGIQDTAFQSLIRSSKSLSLLKIDNEKITDHALSDLGLRSIVDLQLSNLTEISNEGLNLFFRQLTKVESLSLSLIQIYELSNHSGLLDLRRVSISHSLTENAIWTLLKETSRLEYLNFISAPATKKNNSKFYQEKPTT